MSIENVPNNIDKNEKNEVIKPPKTISRLRRWFNNTLMAIMTAGAAATGIATVSATSGCVFDPTGLTYPASDGGVDADGSDVSDASDADVDSDADGDAQVEIEICGNDTDDDNDGLIDCQDIEDCSGFVDPRGFECTSSGDRKETKCNDGIDNDGDWAEDCDDSDCLNDPACVTPTEVCNNGIDDDGDAKADCADPDCVGQTGASGQTCESVEVSCSDGLDNDGDNLSDCADSDCATDPACAPTEVCNNGIDDDGDLEVDCADSDCDGQTGPGGGTCSIIENCTDGYDNNGNGYVGCVDPDCASSSSCTQYVNECLPGANPGDHCDAGFQPCTVNGTCAAYDRDGDGTLNCVCD